MPSASSNVKVEKQQPSNATNAAEIVDNNKVGLDGNSAINQVNSSIAHKIRNLEKRKVSKPNGRFGYHPFCVFWISDAFILLNVQQMVAVHAMAC